jgi:hypothetical protein
VLPPLEIGLWAASSRDIGAAHFLADLPVPMDCPDVDTVRIWMPLQLQASHVVHGLKFSDRRCAKSWKKIMERDWIAHRSIIHRVIV